MNIVGTLLRMGGLASFVVLASAATIPQDPLADAEASALMFSSTPNLVLVNDCFGCYPGGLGEPVICDFGEHFDRTGSSEFFSPRDEMHPGCESFTDCGDHDECDPSEETMDALTAAVAENDVVLLRRFLSSDPKVEFNAERGAIQMLGCRDEVVLHLPVEAALTTALADQTR